MPGGEGTVGPDGVEIYSFTDLRWQIHEVGCCCCCRGGGGGHVCGSWDRYGVS